MRKLIIILILILNFLCADIFTCTTANANALALFFDKVNEIGSIPDIIFQEMRSNGMAEGYTGVIPNNPNGDWVSDIALGGEYEREFTYKKGGESGTSILIASYSKTPAKGFIQIFDPIYFEDSYAFLQANTVIQIRYDYSDATLRTYEALVNTMNGSAVTPTIPDDFWLAVTYNTTDSSYLISSTMVFDDTDGNIVTGDYNVGTVLLQAKVNSSEQVQAYIDRADSDSDNSYDASYPDFGGGQVGTGPWPTPVYFDSVILPDIPESPGHSFLSTWFSGDSDAENLSTWSYNQVKAGNL